MKFVHKPTTETIQHMIVFSYKILKWTNWAIINCLSLSCANAPTFHPKLADNAAFSLNDCPASLYSYVNYPINFCGDLKTIISCTKPLLAYLMFAAGNVYVLVKRLIIEVMIYLRAYSSLRKV